MAIIWHFAAILGVAVCPIYDGRHEIVQGVRGIVKELKGRG